MERSRLRLDRKIAQGGMAEIYIATLTSDHGFEKQVAVKKMLPHIAGDKQHRKSFQREAKITSKLNHPHIAKTFDLIIADNEVLLIIEYLDGTNLETALNQTKFSIEEKFYIAHCVVEAISYAHSFTDPQGGHLTSVVHRDISPHNVFVTSQGEVKVIDFGLGLDLKSQETSVLGMLSGKLPYMAPELFQGENASCATDAFSVGALLFKLFSNLQPFDRPTDAATLKALQSDVRPNLRDQCPDLDPELCETIDSLIAKDPKDRVLRLNQLRQWFIKNSNQEALSRQRLSQNISALKGLDTNLDRETRSEAYLSSEPRPATRMARSWIGLGAVAVAIALGAILLDGQKPNDKKTPQPASFASYYGKELYRFIDEKSEERLDPGELAFVEIGQRELKPDQMSCRNLARSVIVWVSLFYDGDISPFLSDARIKGERVEADSFFDVLKKGLVYQGKIAEILERCSPLLSDLGDLGGKVRHIHAHYALAVADLLAEEPAITDPLVLERRMAELLRQKLVPEEKAWFSWTKQIKRYARLKLSDAQYIYGWSSHVKEASKAGIALIETKSMPSNTEQCSELASSYYIGKLAEDQIPGVSKSLSQSRLMFIPADSKISIRGYRKNQLIFNLADDDPVWSKGLCVFRAEQGRKFFSKFWKPARSLRSDPLVGASEVPENK